MLLNIKYLCFIKLENVNKTFQLITKKYKGIHFKDFFSYFNKQWIHNIKPKVWNYYNFILKNKKITKNNRFN